MKEVKTTFSTCWYRLKAKFDANIYLNWIDNMLKNVNQYYLVIYCDTDSYPDLEKYTVGNSKIKIVVFPLENFHGYQYKEFWVKNHQKNHLLNENTDWKVNMLWNEKIWFVENTIREKYFETDYYGWCDIGYFRGRPNDLPSTLYGLWPNNEKISLLDKSRIHYAIINNDNSYLQSLHRLIQNVDEITGLSKREIPPFQLSIAGGFFILAKEKMGWWKEEYQRKLESYILNDRLVKDDQIILVDCIFSNRNLEEHFILYQEREPEFDNWFMFQRILL